MNRPVCSYVRVLRAGRLLESPRQAARFVSLLAQERAPVLGGGTRHEQWCTMMAFLCRNKVTETSPECEPVYKAVLGLAELCVRCSPCKLWFGFLCV